MRENLVLENVRKVKTQLEMQYAFMDKLKSLISEKSLDTGKTYTYSVVTFGCQMNSRDSEKLCGILEEIGIEETDENHADVVLFNTCTIRENADQRLLGHLGMMKSRKSKNRDLTVIICGCMMQDKKSVDFINKKFGFIDIIFGTHNIYRLPELLYKRLTNEVKKVEEIIEDSSDIVENLPVSRKYFFKSGINITFGCDNFCTYCIVPYVRGREKSRRPEDIIDEIKRVVSDGVIEVMLLGQNVNSYGKGLENPVTFTELLSMVEKIEGLKRIRFMTSNPHDLSDELIEMMGKSKKICTHFHLPLQSGSNRILKDMNRKYTKEIYIQKAIKLRETVPNISITTDIMVGFPGETEEDFLDTMDVVDKVGFDSAFTFIYSKRNGTRAAVMENQVDESVVKDRFKRLLVKVREVAAKRAELIVGMTLDGLVEGIDSHDCDYLSARLSNNMMVHFKGDESLIGKIVDLKIVTSKGFYYLGELVKDE